MIIFITFSVVTDTYMYVFRYANSQPSPPVVAAKPQPPAGLAATTGGDGWLLAYLKTYTCVGYYSEGNEGYLFQNNFESAGY